MPPLHLHRLPRLLRAMSLAFCLALVQAAAWAAPWLDETPRIAIISAFPAEMNLLLARVQAPRPHVVNGVTFATGQLQGKPVVLLHSGISMTNAAMNTQLVLDRFKVTHIVYSGIAGGVNPALHIGRDRAAALGPVPGGAGGPRDRARHLHPSGLDGRREAAPLWRQSPPPGGSALRRAAQGTQEILV